MKPKGKVSNPEYVFAYGNYVFTSVDEEYILCFDAQSGTQLWNFNKHKVSGEYFGVLDDKYLISTNLDQAHAFELKSGKYEWTTYVKTDRRLNYQQVGGDFYFLDKQQQFLNKYSIMTDYVNWNIPIYEIRHKDIYFIGPYIFTKTSSSCLSKVQTFNGHIKYKFPCDNTFAISNDRLIYSCMDKMVVVYDIEVR